MVGNISNFTQFDVLRAFIALREKKSRSGLVPELELGEGTLRTILDILKQKGLTEGTQQGHYLSEKGKTFYNGLEASMSLPARIMLSRFFQQYYNVGIILRKFDEKKKVSYKLRDIAIKNGAEAAMILERNGRLKLLDAEYRGSFDELEQQFSMKPGEILVVTSAKTKRWAEISCLAVAAELNETINLP